jgi:3-isopropylmalate/(R)-2-methylmalate dehydratase large subunit
VSGLTIVEKVLAAHSGGRARAGDTVICDVDRIIGTDGSGPMAIDYFERMAGAGGRVRDGSKICFSLDHYAPPNTEQTRAFHERIRGFATSQGATVFEVGEGISHQVVGERGLALPGQLTVGADSHTVTLGALNCVAIGVGSSDLAAAMLTGQAWLRVPETIRVKLSGPRPATLSAKDVALAIVAELGSDGADYRAIEFAGDALESFDVDDRFVLASLMVEAGAKVAVFPFDHRTAEYLVARDVEGATPVASDRDARFEREVSFDLAKLGQRVAKPHAPENVVPLDATSGTPVQMVFVGTCTGGRAADFHAMRRSFDAAGGRLAEGVQFVLTPASRSVREQISQDGTLAHLLAAGAIVTENGCGACCGTSGVIPGDGATVLSTANRNFRGRMGNATAQIYLASPAACGFAAATGRIPTSAEIGAGA